MASQSLKVIMTRPTWVPKPTLMPTPVVNNTSSSSLELISANKFYANKTAQSPTVNTMYA